MLIVYTMFALLQIGLFILFGISLLTNSNLVESEFVLSAIGLTVPVIVGIIFFRKKLLKVLLILKRRQF